VTNAFKLFFLFKFFNFIYFNLIVKENPDPAEED